MVHRAIWATASRPSPFQSILLDAAARAFARSISSLHLAHNPQPQSRAGSSRSTGRVDAAGAGSAHGVSHVSQELFRDACASPPPVAETQQLPSAACSSSVNPKESGSDAKFSDTPSVFEGRNSDMIALDTSLSTHPTSELSTHTLPRHPTSYHFSTGVSNQSRRPPPSPALPSASFPPRHQPPLLGFSSLLEPPEPPEPPQDYFYLPDIARHDLLPHSHEEISADDDLIPPPPLIVDLHDRRFDSEERVVSAKALIDQLRRYAFTLPVPSINNIRDFHAAHPNFHSIESYNFLLTLALRHRAFRMATDLLQQMRDRAIGADVKTWQLRTRLLVWQGKWPEAFNRIKNYKSDWIGARFALAGESVPVAVWAELVSRDALNHSRRVRDQFGTRIDPGVNSPGRFASVIQLRDEILDQSEGPSSDAVRAIAEVQLRMGEHQAAKSLILAFITAFDEESTIRIINTYLGLRPRKGAASFFQTVEELDSFLSARSDLEPSADTLFLLLRHSEGARHPATIADTVVRKLVHRWGTEIVSGKVRRRMLSLSLREGRKDLIRFYEDLGHPTIKQPTEELTKWDPHRVGLREVYARRGTERDQWWGLSKRALQPRHRPLAQLPDLEGWRGKK